jgi:hypothetical protein
MGVSGQQVEKADLDMLYNMVADFPLRPVARYIGLPDELVQSLTPTEDDEKIDSALSEWVETIASFHGTFNELVQSVEAAYLNIEGWQEGLSTVWACYSRELYGFAIADISSDLQAGVYRDLERTRLDFKSALTLESRGGILPSTETEVDRLLAGINSHDRSVRFLEVAILALTSDLLEDLDVMIHQFSRNERNDQYYSAAKGKGDFTLTLGERIDKSRVLDQASISKVNRMLYRMKCGGYKALELQAPVRGASGRPISTAAIQERYQRMRNRIDKK